MRVAIKARTVIEAAEILKRDKKGSDGEYYVFADASCLDSDLPREGTPPNLGQAIVNALKELSSNSVTRKAVDWRMTDYEVQIILKHVQDRIAQEFGVEVMRQCDRDKEGIYAEQVLLNLFKRIFPK